MSIAAEMIAQLPAGADVIRLSVVGKIAGIHPVIQAQMARDGVIPVLNQRRAYHPYLVTRETAMLVLAGTALATAAEIAVTPAIKAVLGLARDPVVIAAAIVPEALN